MHSPKIGADFLRHFDPVADYSGRTLGSLIVVAAGSVGCQHLDILAESAGGQYDRLVGLDIDGFLVLGCLDAHNSVGGGIPDQSFGAVDMLVLIAL